MASFQRLTPDQPTPEGAPLLLWEPLHQRVVLVVEADGPRPPRPGSGPGRQQPGRIEVWTLAAHEWMRVARGLLPDPTAELKMVGPTVGWIDPATRSVVIGRLAATHQGKLAGLYTTHLEGGAAPSQSEEAHLLAVESAPRDLGDAADPSAANAAALEPDRRLDEKEIEGALAVWHPRLQRPVILIRPRAAQLDGEEKRSARTRVFAVEGNRLVSMGAAPDVRVLAVDEDKQEALGIDDEGNVHAFDGATFRKAGTTAGASSAMGLAWHGPLGALVTLRPSATGVSLAAWSGTTFETVVDGASVPGLDAEGALLVTPQGRVINFGSRSVETGLRCVLVAEPGDRELRPRHLELVAPASRTAITTAKHLLLVDHPMHRPITVQRVDGERLESFCGTPLEDADRLVNFAASDEEVFLLDGEGALWSALRGAAFRQVAPPEPELERISSHRVAMAWDVPSRSVVAFGGVGSNRTWTFASGAAAWEELQLSIAPPPGMASAVSTVQGVYLLAGAEDEVGEPRPSGAELFVLRHRDWTRVASGLPGDQLLFDAKRERLLIAGYDFNSEAWTLWAVGADGRAVVALRLPEHIRLGSVAAPTALLAVDPGGDRLLVQGKRESHALALGDLDGLPRGRPREG
jgi:hypothetical protein